jgi:RND family efflux transporter MFP subunit
MKKILYSLLILISSLSAQKIYATFDVVAMQSANLAFSSSGIVKNINVDVGSVVKKDDIVASLDNDDLKAMVDIYKTTLKYAKKDYDRQIQIRNLIDAVKFDSYEKAYATAKVQLQYQEKLLDKTILKAPFDGIIISKEIEVGDVVSGQMIQTVLKIQSEHKRKLILQFDQKYYNDVKVGDIYTYGVDGDEKTYSAIITKIYPYANTKTRKVKAEVMVKDIFVGLFGDGYITKP